MSQSSAGADGGLHEKPKIVYRRDCSLLIDVGDNKRVKSETIISAACKLCGHENIFGCVPRSGNMFEITTSDRKYVDILEDGLYIGTNLYESKKFIQDKFVVSLMHLPTYITDNEIEQKLTQCDANIISPIKRRFVEVEGNKFADGTRFCNVRLNENKRSLPFTMKFHDGICDSYYRVIHDGQCKTCSVCGSHTHLRKECPEFVCFQCGVQGHMKRHCPAEKCRYCRRYKCVCEEEPENDENGENVNNINVNVDEVVNDENDGVTEENAECTDMWCRKCRAYLCKCKFESSDEENQIVDLEQEMVDETEVENESKDGDEYDNHNDNETNAILTKEPVFGDMLDLTECTVPKDDEIAPTNKPVETPTANSDRVNVVKPDNSDKRKRPIDTQPADDKTNSKLRIVERQQPDT